MLELNAISVGYGKQNILGGVTGCFEKGELTSVIGVNGCGKSTLLKAMLGILPVKDGTVTVDGQNLSHLSRNEIAKKIAYLAQGKNTPDMTVFQMVLHGRFPYLSYPRRYTGRDREAAQLAMERVGIAHLADRPLGALSGGMRQIAYIAMALAQDTEYIFLDEPTAYLDIAHQLALMRILRELADSGKGVIAVMHDLPMAFDFSDKITVLNDRKVVLQATPMGACDSPVIPLVFGVTVRYAPGENRFLYRYPDCAYQGTDEKSPPFRSPRL